MKTTKMMMNAMFAMMMSMMAMTASAATNANANADRHQNNKECRCNDCMRRYDKNFGQGVVSGRGSHRTIEKDCFCKECQKIRKQMDKHMRKYHYGKQNRMACRECMMYSHKLNSHKRYETVCNDCKGHSNHSTTVYYGRR